MWTKIRARVNWLHSFHTGGWRRDFSFVKKNDDGAVMNFWYEQFRFVQTTKEYLYNFNYIQIRVLEEEKEPSIEINI